MNSSPRACISIDTHTMSPSELRAREWLVTNGLGGYASGTLHCETTRRYHGLFTANLADPNGRHLMIARFDEEVVFEDDTVCIGVDAGVRNDSNLRRFRLEGNVAIWTYAVRKTVFERRVFMPHEQNTVCVHYTQVSGPDITLRLRPYFAFRRQDAPLNGPDFGQFAMTIEPGRYEANLKQSRLTVRMAMKPDETFFVAKSVDVAQSLPREQSRGNPHEECVRSLGYFEARLRSEKPCSFIASTQNWARLQFNVEEALNAELRRVEKLIEVASAEDEFEANLVNAADRFLVLPASRIEETVMAAAEGHELRTVIAGYHWFGDWGRDTMISLDGLMLCTGRRREARETLKTFSNYVHHGLLPNLFPEGERQGLYHTVDATLWYFHAIHRYWLATSDNDLIRELLPVLKTIVAAYEHGTDFGIRMDPDDGLIAAAAPGVQLTWMDAKMGDWVVTPRRGKAVEIQALWHNALSLMGEWSANDTQAREHYLSLAKLCRESFNARYWNEGRHCLFDVIDGEVGDDTSFRPNQIFAISLKHPILDQAKWRPVVDAVTSELQTPYGLRTLSRDHPDFKPTYHGDLRTRDAAYHQGTVWPWLLGHFIDAWLKVYSDRAMARRFLAAFPDHLRLAGIGSISEVFDAQIPHDPHGCIAQAWSVAEVLRAWKGAKEERSDESGRAQSLR